MMSITVGWDGTGCLVAAEYALEQINYRQDILPEYELIMLWNDTQVLFAAYSPTLSNRVRYPNVYRTVPIGTNVFSDPYIWFIKEYGWSRVGFISKSAISFSMVSQLYFVMLCIFSSFTCPGA
ncbi:Gamma-aminobutyric acid type B receptor subunit 2 [Holothuria leucospilota]|uniref:Gamma-aminobutyric acid type B receptor subunit 2 n=1 Tax=Holothuria leucospilota TaxID=206669 RepID=A0A9Q0YPR9_HOLLE|nr:Gamma-aminobutyric acid type B receptor subunit 2 [Holothuria leucospilota]